MFCQKCGSELTDGMTICPKCGSEVDFQNDSENQTKNDNSQKKPKRKSKIKNFLKGYKSFKELSLISKLFHVVVLVMAIDFLAIIVGSFFITPDDSYSSSGNSSSGSSRVVKSNSELGYDFNATLDDFVENWNTVTEEEYGESSIDDISINSIQHMRDESSGGATYGVYLFNDPINPEHMAVSIHVNKDTGNIAQITYIFDKELFDKSDSDVRYNYKYRYSRRIFGCLTSTDDVIDRIDSAVNSKNGISYKNNIVTQVTLPATGGVGFTMSAASKDYYNAIIDKLS